jgi:hypothetical protein
MKSLRLHLVRSCTPSHRPDLPALQWPCLASELRRLLLLWSKLVVVGSGCESP